MKPPNDESSERVNADGVERQDGERRDGSRRDGALVEARLRREIARLQTRIVELERLADTDTLTPLANRRAFAREVERVVAHTARHATPAAVLFLDVDNLKALNDEWGHQLGDAVLVHVARLLRREVRASDIVARVGGDEFGLVLDRLDEGAARLKAAALADAVAANPLREGDAIVALGLSVGMTMVRQGDTAAAVLARADAAMYASKPGRIDRRRLRAGAAAQRSDR